uniref:Immunoglobulin domain-containing protein n=1 Tax=Oreochromis niloticus TaxID=8128 RepID=A0A669EFE7_ORENI
MVVTAHVHKSYSKISYSPFSIIPSRLQLFEYESVSFTCEGFNISAGWKVRSTKKIPLKCSSSTVTKTCGIKYAFASDSGEYWCESGAERSNTVSITVSAGAVILESPVHPVVEGDAVILHCRNKTDKQDANFTADFYKDSLPMGTSYDGKLEIQKVSKSHEGFYKCKIQGVRESPESWLAVRSKSNARKGIVFFLFFPFCLMVARWLALLLHSKKVLSSIPPSGRGLSVRSLHVLPVFAWVLSRYSGFLPQSRDMQLVGIG